MDNAMLRPRFLHGDGQYRAKIAIANAHCRQSNRCTEHVPAVKLTEDNAMFGPRFSHGYARHHAKIAIANAVEHFERAISRAPSRLYQRHLARAFHTTKSYRDCFWLVGRATALIGVGILFPLRGE